MEYIGKRISVLRSPDELSVVILSEVENKKSTLLFLWLLGWTAGGLIVFWEFLQVTEANRKPGFIIWLAFWFYFEYTISKAYMWRRNGKEKIKLKRGTLSIKREVNKKGKASNYDLGLMKDFRLVLEKSKLMNSLNNSYWSVAGETITFDYYGKTISFGLQLNEEDSKALYKLIKHGINEFNKGE
jgi:hypothetical protein